MNKQRTEQKRRKVAEFLCANHVEIEEVAAHELHNVVMNWRKSFARNTKSREESFFLTFKWHYFSYGCEPALSGEDALRAYHNTKGRFFLFNEDETFGFHCKTQFPFRPDLSDLHADLYIVATDFSWTMVFTHEQPNIGPFFAKIAVSK